MAARPMLQDDRLIRSLKPYFAQPQWVAEPVFNVQGRDFGALGDGAAEDAVAINRALTAAAAFPGSTVWLPPTEVGIYRIAAPLYVPHSVTLKAALGVSIRQHASFSGFGVIVAQDWLDNVTANQGGIALENITIIGNPGGVAGNYHGIVTLGQDGYLNQCMVTGVKGDGILLTNKTQDGDRLTPGVNFNRQVVRDCRVHTCTGTGIRLDGPTDGYILANHVNECDEDGIGTSADADNGTIGGGGWQIVGNHISEAGQDGIRLGSAGFGAVIALNNIENFGVELEGTGTYHGIVLPWAGTHGIVVEANPMWTDEDNAAGGGKYILIGVESSGDGNVQVAVKGNFGRGNLGAIPIEVKLGAGATSIGAQVSNNQMHRVVEPEFLTDFIRGNENSWDYKNAPPTTGTWRRSMRVWDDTASAAAAPGWVCTAGGAPGTWKALAALAA